VQWYQSRFAELGLADQQAVAGHVGGSQRMPADKLPE
jgi:hypothetical protein